MEIKGMFICDGKACTLCKTDTTGCIRTFNENHAINNDSVELVHLIKENFNKDNVELMHLAEEKFNIILYPSTNETLYFIEKGEFDE
ncbi:MAG: hypothetical protein IKP66_05395 [Lachnospiraceae bacterium]|nr:hypothetical protein [Lachnospiraceae bacterium]